jgi:hypothetical protein
MLITNKYKCVRRFCKATLNALYHPCSFSPGLQIRSLLPPSSGHRSLQQLLAGAITPPDAASLTQAIANLHTVQVLPPPSLPPNYRPRVAGWAAMPSGKGTMQHFG